MRVRWTEPAAGDLESISDYLTEQSDPETATRIVRVIYEAARDLATFPHRGRPGKKHGTRELVIPALPYIIVYQVTDSAVLIFRILHGRQRWP